MGQVHYSGEFAPTWLPSKLVEGGDPTGMYHLIFGNGQNAVVCNGESPHIRGEMRGVKLTVTQVSVGLA